MQLTQTSRYQDNESCLERPISAFDLIGMYARELWKDWSGDMEAVLLEVNNRKFSLRGECPHCHRASSFLLVTSVYTENMGQGVHRWIAGMQCQACVKLILGIANFDGNAHRLTYEAHYPLGKPDDNVDEAVPPKIAADFKEALRCNWIDAWKACVVMCRRAVQSSALGLGAPKGKKLTHQIDDLFAKGKITEPLKDFAHEVRLTGNLGAHPGDGSDNKTDLLDVDDLEDVTKRDADDIILFTREYLHHVYVMPAKLKARRTPPPQ